MVLNPDYGTACLGAVRMRIPFSNDSITWTKLKGKILGKWHLAAGIWEVFSRPSVTIYHMDVV